MTPLLAPCISCAVKPRPWRTRIPIVAKKSRLTIWTLVNVGFSLSGERPSMERDPNTPPHGPRHRWGEITAAERTPGRACTCCRSCLRNTAARSPAGYFVIGTSRCMTATFFGRKPKSSFCNRIRLCTNIPTPTSRVSAMAICETTRPWHKRRQLRSVTGPDDSCLKVLTGPTPPAFQPGSRPNANPTSTDSPSVKNSTVPSIRVLSI